MVIVPASDPINANDEYKQDTPVVANETPLPESKPVEPPSTPAEPVKAMSKFKFPRGKVIALMFFIFIFGSAYVYKDIIVNQVKNITHLPIISGTGPLATGSSANPGFVPSVSGDVHLNITNRGGIQNVTTYDNKYYIYGYLDNTNNDVFITIKLNNALIDTGAISNNVKVMPDNKKSFHYEVSNLKKGANTIILEVWASKNRDKLLTSATINVTKLDIIQGVINPNISIPTDTNVKTLFIEKLRVQVSSDKPWNYTDKYYKDDSAALASWMGEGQDFVQGSIKSQNIGSISVNNENLPLYRIIYDESANSLNGDNNSLTTVLGYIKDNTFYYFPNAIYKSVNKGHPLLFYLTSSPYTLPLALSDLGKISIPNSSDFLVLSKDVGIACDSKFYQSYYISKKLFNVGSFEISSFGPTGDTYFYIAKDQYGICGKYLYHAAFFNTTEPHPTKPDFFYKIEAILFQGSLPNVYYSPLWYWCGGSNGYRILNQKKVNMLTKIGETSKGNGIYIFSSNFPYPSDNQHFIPTVETTSSDRNSGWSGYIKAEQWQSFIDNQVNSYPVLIIMNDFGDYMMYYREDYILYPGC